MNAETQRAAMTDTMSDERLMDFFDMARVLMPASIAEIDHIAARLSAQAATAVPEKMAPVQGFSGGIPWAMHLRAYDAYSKKWAPQKAMIEGGCRGGFSVGELDQFIPGWRDELSELHQLRAKLAQALASRELVAEGPLHGKYADVLAPFLALMEIELHANSRKGDRPGWLAMSKAVGMLEIYYHAAKLQKAVKDEDLPSVREYAADVANMAMMLLDVCGGLDCAGTRLASSEHGGAQ